MAAALFGLVSSSAALAGQDIGPVVIPAPNPAPLSAADENDPVLLLARALSDPDAFREVIAEAVKASPSIAEGKADGAAAIATRENAEAQLLPRVDLAMSANTAFAREFSNDPDNVIERSRGKGRVDATLSAEQIVIDFGASVRRVDAAVARIESSEAELDRKTETAALRAISVWYELFAYGHLVELAKSYLDRTNALRPAIEQRIAQGVAAPVERARLDSAIASGKMRRPVSERILDCSRRSVWRVHPRQFWQI
jgi:outer membrane protein, adhesin transport system